LRPCNISMNYSIKKVPFPVWHLKCNTSASNQRKLKDIRSKKNRKSVSSVSGSVFSLSWAAHGQQLQQEESSILWGDALLSDDKGERETDPPRALELIFSCRVWVHCFYSWALEKHLDTWHAKHHSTTSNYSTEPHKPQFSSFTQ